MNPVFALLLSAGLMYFFWGGAMFTFSAGNDTRRVEGRNRYVLGTPRYGGDGFSGDRHGSSSRTGAVP